MTNNLPCDDAVSRREALKCLNGTWGDYSVLNEVFERINKLPSVTQNGTPIPDKEQKPCNVPTVNVLDKIRAEIIEKYWDCDICKYNGHFNIRGDINDILQIIDKHTM